MTPRSRTIDDGWSRLDVGPPECHMVLAQLVLTPVSRTPMTPYEVCLCQVQLQAVRRHPLHDVFHGGD